MDTPINRRFQLQVNQLANELMMTPRTHVNTHLHLVRARREILDSANAPHQFEDVHLLVPPNSPSSPGFSFSKRVGAQTQRQRSALTLALRAPDPKTKPMALRLLAGGLRVRPRPSALVGSIAKPILAPSLSEPLPILPKVLPNGNIGPENPSQNAPLDPASKGPAQP